LATAGPFVSTYEDGRKRYGDECFNFGSYAGYFVAYETQALYVQYNYKCSKIECTNMHRNLPLSSGARR